MKFNLIFIIYYASCGVVLHFTRITNEVYDFMAYSLGLFIIILTIYNIYKASEYIKNRLFKR